MANPNDFPLGILPCRLVHPNIADEQTNSQKKSRKKFSSFHKIKRENEQVKIRKTDELSSGVWYFESTKDNSLWTKAGNSRVSLSARHLTVFILFSNVVPKNIQKKKGKTGGWTLSPMGSLAQTVERVAQTLQFYFSRVKTFV